MKCPKCQAESDISEEFCKRCGARLRRTCPICGAVNPVENDFCGECGLKLPAEAPRDERIKLKKVCPRCGAHNPPDYAFCGECGYELIPGAREKPEAPPPKVEVPQAAPAPKVEAPQAAVAAEMVPPIAEAAPVAPAEPAVPEAAAHQVEAVQAAPAAEEKAAPLPEAAPIAPPEPLIPAPVAEIKAARVSTGIEGLDRLIGGGLLPNKVYLVAGESGTGKTVFGLQYLYHGLLQGENGIYVSGSERPDYIVADAESLGWDFGKYVKERKLGTLDISSHFTGLLAGKSKDVNVGKVVADISKQVKSLGARRIVIDPVAPLTFGEETLPGIREYVRKLIFAIEDKLKCTILITSGVVSGASALSRYGIEEFVAEGVIVLGTDFYEGKHVRILLLKKMRDTRTDIDEHIFEIFPGRGIVVEG